MGKWRNTSEQYGALARWLHWSFVALIAFQMIGAELIDAFPRESFGRRFLLDTHESVGLAALLLVAARLAWKLANATPVGTGPPWQQRLARTAHGALYLLLIVIPVVGYVVAAARGHDPALFGLTVPSLVEKNRPLARAAKEIHEVLGWTLVALALAHAGAAIWHHVVLRDDTLRRMLPQRSRRQASMDAGSTNA
jgi:superoxide oxidase